MAKVPHVPRELRGSVTVARLPYDLSARLEQRVAEHRFLVDRGEWRVLGAVPAGHDVYRSAAASAQRTLRIVQKGRLPLTLELQLDGDSVRYCVTSPPQRRLLDALTAVTIVSTVTFFAGFAVTANMPWVVTGSFAVLFAALIAWRKYAKAFLAAMSLEPALTAMLQEEAEPAVARLRVDDDAIRARVVDQARGAEDEPVATTDRGIAASRGGHGRVS